MFHETRLLQLRDQLVPACHIDVPIAINLCLLFARIAPVVVQLFFHCLPLLWNVCQDGCPEVGMLKVPLLWQNRLQHNTLA